MNLEDLTDAQLQGELLRRREVARAKELKERHERNLLVHQHLDTLLLFVKHRGKCDDKSTTKTRLCPRCELLECKAYNLPLDEDFDIEITVFHSVI